MIIDDSSTKPLYLEKEQGQSGPWIIDESEFNETGLITSVAIAVEATRKKLGQSGPQIGPTSRRPVLRSRALRCSDRSLHQPTPAAPPGTKGVTGVTEHWENRTSGTWTTGQTTDLNGTEGFRERSGLETPKKRLDKIQVKSYSLSIVYYY